MMNNWMTRLMALLVAVIALATGARADDFLEPDQAFQLKGELIDTHTVRLSWAIAPGYHLYRDRLSFKADGAQLEAPALPAGLRKFDTNFNKEMETYQDSLMVQLPVTAMAAFTLQVGYQGCADAGLCYSPATQSYRVDPAAPGKLVAVDAPPASAAAAAPPHEDDSSLAQRTLQSGSAWRIGLAFLAFGLLLSFTPCVLPMVPILSSIIVGEGAVSRSRGFSLALAYCLGMALVYTSLGVAAGLAGEGLAGALQKPWVLLTFGALLVGLALSMFDVYQLQLPSALQSRLSATSGNMGGGRFDGVFVMGALSALIVGPCVAGPLAGALLYISQTRDVMLGGIALFAMSIGMGVPLILVGVFEGAFLPKSGHWMRSVKHFFGVLLLAVAIWIVSPVLPPVAQMLAWAALLIGSAMVLRAIDPLPPETGIAARLWKGVGFLALLAGAALAIGALSGSRDVLRPLAGLVGGGERGVHEVRFTRVKNLADLETKLVAAGKPVMLDFYADWCVSCKEMEAFTFTDAQVKAKLDWMLLLQADVTANSPEDKALLKRFSLFGPPGIIFFDRQGGEIPGLRVIGYQPAERFLTTLDRAVDL